MGEDGYPQRDNSQNPQRRRYSHVRSNDKKPFPGWKNGKGACSEASTGPPHQLHRRQNASSKFRQGQVDLSTPDINKILQITLMHMLVREIPVATDSSTSINDKTAGNIKSRTGSAWRSLRNDASHAYTVGFFQWLSK